MSQPVVEYPVTSKPILIARVLGPAVLLAAAFAGPVRAGDPPADEGKPLDEYFRGKVVSLERGVVTLRYDFEEESQLKDWFEAVPFPVKRQSEQGVAWVDEKMEIKGSTAARHVAAWSKDLRVEAKLKLGETRNVGGLLTPDSETNDFATFTLREFYFHSWDRGQRGGQHSIIKFGDRWREEGAGGDFIGFRYLIRKPPAKPLIQNRTIPFSFGMKRGRLLMDVQGQAFKVKDMGAPLKVFRPGFYTVKAQVLIDDVVIVGRLDPEWLRENDVALRIETPASDE